MEKENKHSILLVDGFALERASMRAVLSREENIGDIVEANDPGEVTELLKNSDVSLMICSIITVEADHLQMVAKLLDVPHPIPVLLLGPDSRLENMIAFMKMGVKGYIPKSAGQEVLMEGVQTVLQGDDFFPQPGKNWSQITEHGSLPVSALVSGREKEILQLVILGMNNVQIGEKLSISTRTVENHRANMMRKLQVKNTAELVKIAIERHIVD